MHSLAPSARVGIGLRFPHLNEVVATLPATSWFEVHAENFLSNSHALTLLKKIREHYPIAIHSVGVSVGSVNGVDSRHLERVRELVVCIEPFLVSGHLAWSTHAGHYLNDLLPLPYDQEALRIVSNHVDEVQSLLRCRYLIENPASYVALKSTMSETTFLSQLVKRTDCGVLCDISNLIVNATNMGIDPRQYLKELPANAVAEFHIGGYEAELDEAANETILIDTHSCGPSSESWSLYRFAMEEIGVRPTLIEWDSNIPELSILLEEAARAEEVLGSIRNM